MDAVIYLDEKTLTGDLSMDGAGLAVDGGLGTAIAISLFTDRRAHPDDILPGDGAPRSGGRGGGDRRGWWGDGAPPVVDGAPAEGDRIGSRLWLLGREKIVPETIARARTYVREALQWLIDDGVAARVDVAVEAAPGGVLAIAITVRRPTGANGRFDYVWRARADQTAKGGNG
ncbi:phage GP46 family protein [Varunaivibrio sulfuroxidans]|uniref:Phage gp46-like protein n=1 Tax=Varunaivibrio sulfuroxidans TaxID=1773489 RepID=A0A4R3JAK6_9PROT|nr:phage GP46 family protein [Varunaivibrio sulfuroxidans]TCS62594.1 phage gp46-like protein [Varunaivibrio sulfuroxidans]WES30737.1 phage GP46 family protein [Varunaivibrio sulfuroxidans]